jgi:hypothetical protein
VEEAEGVMRHIWLITRVIFIVAAGVLCRHSCVGEGRTAGTTNEPSPTPPVCLSVVIPSYIYPSAGGSAWNTFIAHPVRSTKVERIMIVNPNSGPGTDANTEYRNIVAAAQWSGNRVYGYVSTRYGKVDAQTVQEEVGKYIKWYGVDGIFVDEVSADAAQVARYYQPLVTFITSSIDGGGVILNAGTYPDERYAEIKVLKHSKLQIVVFEHDYASFTAASFEVPAWIRNYPPSMFINIVYDTPADDVTEVLQLSAKRGASSVYVTDQTMPNPYAALPSYWAELNRAVQAGCVR